MKKLFISVPMKGRTEENIRNSIEKMHRVAEAVFGEELEVIDSYIEHKPPQNSNEAIWYLGKSLEKLSKADYFIGIRWSDCFGGCNIESEVAIRYGIKTYLVELELFPDAVEAAREFWEKERNTAKESERALEGVVG